MQKANSLYYWLSKALRRNEPTTLARVDGIWWPLVRCEGLQRLTPQRDWAGLEPARSVRLYHVEGGLVDLELDSPLVVGVEAHAFEGDEFFNRVTTEAWYGRLALFSA